MSDTDQQQPTTPASDAQSRCVDYGQTVSICDHVAKRLVDPMAGYLQGRIEELGAALAASRRLSEYRDETLRLAMQRYEQAETDLAASRAMSALWKAEAKKGRKGEVTLLVAVCRSQETINEILIERDDWKRAWHEMTAIVASHYSKLQDSRAEHERLAGQLRDLAAWICDAGGWRAFYYGEPLPESLRGVFDLSDRFNPEAALAAAATPPAPDEGAGSGNQ